jgi:hypothetical protein
LSNSSEGGPVFIFKCETDTIEAKWGVGKRADIYLEVRKRRGAYIL